MSKKNAAVKAAVLAAVIGTGAYLCATMDSRVVSALKSVETIRMSRTAFRRCVSARGSLYEKEGEWYAAAAVDESDISAVSAGQEAEITCAALSAPLYGMVESVSDSARNEGGRTFVDVIIRLDEGGEGLRSGYSAQCGIYVDETRILSTLPYDVIRQDDEGEYVYVYDSNKAVRRGIVTGIELSGETEIIGGLSEQSEIIAAPDKVTANEPVRRESDKCTR